MQCCDQYQVGAHLHAFGMHCLVNAMLCKRMNAHGTSSSSGAPGACPALVLMSARDHQLANMARLFIHSLSRHALSQTHMPAVAGLSTCDCKSVLHQDPQQFSLIGHAQLLSSASWSRWQAHADARYKHNQWHIAQKAVAEALQSV